ncbi:2-hydroxyacyl-CoA dehydratase family protein [bacterium]|nr:2-hydroxyacyl-CoA dehydratase family protein [bacterium]
MNRETYSRKDMEERLLRKVKKDIQCEHDIELMSLRERDDFSSEFEYFLEILSLGIYPQKFKERFNKPLAGLYCVQVPLELFDALGFHPFRLCSGSLAIQRLSSGRVPSLTCPIIKSCLSSFYLDESMEKLCDLIVIPTTCDWNAKLPEIIGDKANSIHIMELPHIKESERGRERWIQEVYELKKVLEVHAGRRLNRRQLSSSIKKYMSAWQVLGQLIELRRRGAISGTWSIIIANAFMLDNVESWTEKVKQVLKNYNVPKKKNNPDVFLTGSPVFFPNLKISELIEEAGMFIAGDELCTSERNLTGATICDDYSEHGILKTLAERYQLSCSCPSFADNYRRAKNILDTMRIHNIKGVIYHILKGCHPYDIESFYFEKMIKENGYHFIKIETDYSHEDRQNILIRLEAFRETLC